MTSASTASCPKCSAELAPDAVFCHRCGTPTPPTITGAGTLEYTPKDSAEAAKHKAELQRLLGDSCELRGLLGRGGFAEVYEAWDPRLKRALAVKTLRTDLMATDALVERFRLEAESIAQLRHPNVIPIYSVGGEGSVGYFVMPKVDGGSLAALLAREGQLPFQECCRILREAASALATAHRAGIIHRDIKPENILLDGHDRRVLVMDFGIAKSLDSMEKGLTGTGMLVGTPQYMSPEQAAGDRKLDHASDQYALATVGYRMLTGQLPFDDDSVQTIIFKQVTEPPRPIAELAPGVPAAVASVIERALAKRPADRFESMDAFGKALDSAIHESTSEKSLRARVPDMPARIEAVRRALPSWKHPLVAAALVAGVASIVLAPRTVYRSAYELGARRDDAVFAAKTFLAGRGIAGSLDHVAEFHTRDTLSTYHFLIDTLGGRAIEERFNRDIPFWTWRVRLRSKTDKMPWVVDLGAGNRVVAYSHQVFDTTAGARLTATQAEPAALRELAARGWNPATLQRRPDSTITHPSRIDHIFRWARPESAIPWRAGDTAFVIVSVVVRGADVTGYSEHLETPFRYRQEHTKAQRAVIFSLVVTLFVIGGLALGVGLLIARSRKDNLQWGFGAKTTLAIVASLAPTLLLVALPDWLFNLPSAEDPVALGALSLSLGIAFLGGAFLVLVVLAESFSAEYRPEMLAGMADLMRGRLAVPEIASAAVWGSIWGLLLDATQRLLSLTSILTTGTRASSSVSELVTLSMPVVDIPSRFSAGFAASFLVGALLLVVFHFRRSAAVALGSVVAFGTLMALVSPDTLAPERADDIVSFAAMAFVLWRYGLLAATFMAFVDTAAAISLAFTYGSSGGFGGILLVVGTFLVPFALAIYAYRRAVAARLATGAGASRS
jgi:tRNA A-37 threonylcarbamoyl transferase component Bud32